MKRVFNAKIHRATVSHSDLHYEGSVSIDRSLMDAAGIEPWEEVHVWDVTNGSRLTTYAIPAASDSGIVGINGAAAHLVDIGDIVILATFIQIESTAVSTHSPTVVFVDSENRVIDQRLESNPLSGASQR